MLSDAVERRKKVEGLACGLVVGETLVSAVITQRCAFARGLWDTGLLDIVGDAGRAWT